MDPTTPRAVLLASLTVVTVTAVVACKSSTPKATTVQPVLNNVQASGSPTPRAVANQITAGLMQSETWNEQTVRNQAARDQFAWRMFAAISIPEEVQKTGQSDVVWERWIDNPSTFIDPSTTPRFPDEFPVNKSPEVKRFQSDKVLELFARRSTAPRGKQSPHFVSSRTTEIPAQSMEQVYRNETAFDVIRTQHFWYSYGLSKAARGKTSTTIQENVLTMSPGSIQLKAMWTTLSSNISASQCGAKYAKYHVYYAPQTGCLGLVALHMMAKVNNPAVNDPKWIWASWEWAGDGHTQDGLDGNLGRCDTTCRDAFGLDQSSTTTIASNPETGKAYKPEPLNSTLLQIFAVNHLGDEWKNYRLKGTQLDFMSPATLGNSQIEAPYTATSSCSTCHSRASITLGGNADVALNDQIHPIFTFDAHHNQVGPTGPTKDEWFTHPGLQGSVQVYYQTDSVWSFIRATQ